MQHIANIEIPPNLTGYDVSIIDSNTKRVLTSTSASVSSVTGSGITTIEPYKNYTVTVTAKDSGGVLIGTGGDSFYVRISNECTISSQVDWTVVGGAASTMSSPFEALMTYNGDGTYSYNYTLSVTGKISLWVILRNTGIIYGSFYTNTGLAGAAAASNISTTIDYLYGGGTVVGGQTDNVSAQFRTYLRPNVTDTYTIYVLMDDGASLYIGGTQYTSSFCTLGASEPSVSVSLTAFTNYYLVLNWCQGSGGSNIRLSWSYTGVAKTVIPYPNYVWPQFVGSSPYTFTVSCLSGYTNTNTNHPSEWYPIWGDGLRLGVEVWDDGNTNSNDGWSSDCLLVEYNWTWSGGSSSSKDAWSCYVAPIVTSKDGNSLKFDENFAFYMFWYHFWLYRNKRENNYNNCYLNPR